MSIQAQIKQDLMTAMKSRDDVRKNTLRVVMGEFGRAESKKLGDDAVIKILRKLIKSEKETLAQTGSDEDSAFIQIIEAYLPQPADESEIRTWIQENIDFSRLRSKMQAMGPIMKHFGARANGNDVKAILQKR